MSISSQQNTDSSICNPDKAEFDFQLKTLQDYEHFQTGYQSSSYLKKSSEVALSRNGFECSYGTENSAINGCQIDIPKNNSDSEIPKLGAISTVRYIQASQYEDLPDYGISACPSEPHYLDDPVSYGYVSEVNFGYPIDGTTNPYSPRSGIFDNNLNGAESTRPSDINSRRIETNSDFKNKMTRASLNDFAFMKDSKHILLESTGNDMCPSTKWRDPNLSEVISFLNNPNDEIKANAAAYLQHLCYMDDPNKQRTRSLGGIPPLVRLLAYDVPDIHKNACGALRNLSYGRQNDENKRAIKDTGGITALVNLLCRTQESEVKELVTGVLWNMSSCEDIKRSIIDESLDAIVINIILPHSGWDVNCPGDTCYSTVFRNASGVLRNISSAGEYARAKLRDSKHLVESLIYVIKTAVEKNNIGNKTVENCVCILRNLSFRCQEVEDPNYDKHPMPTSSRPLPSTRGDNLGCFGTSKKKKEPFQIDQQEESKTKSNSNSKNTTISIDSSKSYEKLWQPEIVQYYLSLLQSCSNPETLEAAAGAIQNLSACYWQPSADIRATVRKEKGLPILVELLRMEVDRVVCAVATALRNLAIDQRNKELIGKYAMRDLIQKLPSGNAQHDQNTSDDTVTAVLATINEVIKKNAEFSRSLLDAGGVDRLLNITKQRQKYTACVLKFACQVLYTMWQHNDLRDVYKKNGWREQDFISKSFASHNTSPNSPNNANSTLNRPMASQSRTRYEDRTIQRGTTTATANGGEFNESSLLCQMADEVSVCGDGNEAYQRGVHNSKLALYVPLIDSRRNHSN